MAHYVKVILADGHKMVREAFAYWLNQQPPITVVGHAGNSSELLDLMQNTEHDVVIYGLEPPVVDCKETLYYILGKYRESRVIVLTSYFNLQLLNYYMANGASAYLPKECGYEVLLQAVNTVPYQKFYPQDLHAVLHHHSHEKFTDTELVILKLICTGKTNKEIAELTKTACNTVAWHRKNIYEKANVNCSALLALFAVQNGIISIHEAEFSQESSYRI
jgi:DNA-binding NarL/FixJ family response regulator